MQPGRVKYFSVFMIIFFAQMSFAQNTVIDEIMRDYKQAASFAHFLGRVQSKVLPGDDVFLFRKLKNSPDLLRAKKLPSLVYENGLFTLMYNKAEYTFRLSDRQKFEFEINGQKVILHPSMIPSYRWTALNNMIAASASKTSFYISLMPVAFAQQSGEPTFSNVIMFSIISRLAHEATHGLEIKTENPNITFLQMMKKIKEYRSHCDLNYLTELMQKMASVQANTMKCESKPNHGKKEGHLTGNVSFEVPFGDNAFRKIYLNREQQIFQEDAPDYPGKTLVFKKLYTETNVDFTPTEPTEKKRVRALRQKGLEWVPVGETTPEIKERAEQLRELVNFIYSTDFCNRCGLNVRHALKDLSIDLEMNPNVDQYGNQLQKEVPKKVETKTDSKFVQKLRAQDANKDANKEGNK